MALEPGGYADKLGNRFEGRWVARQLLLLLREQIQSVTLESAGDDEAGADLWLVRHDGIREAQQCKAENGTKSHWSLADLKNRGVLGRLRFQLERDPKHEFTFVSGSPAPQLRDLTRSAKDSSGDAESFYRDQIQAGSRERKNDFSEWCRCLGLMESNANDRTIAFDLLRRSGFHEFVDTRETREDLKFMAQQAVRGEPDTVIAVLAEFATDNLRKVISVADIAQHLRNSGLEPRQLFADDRLEPRLNGLNEDFVDSISPHLAGARFIERAEVEVVLKALESESLPDAIVLHGPAGFGKSGVLYQLTEKLREQRTPFLALRLDRKPPRGSARLYGEHLGLPESPVNCLAAVSRGKQGVLILDQLDALRWTSAHSAEGLEVCNGLLREVRSTRWLGSHISVVICCRTFDLEHDPQIRNWLTPTQNFNIQKVAVGELPETRVREFVQSFGVSFDRITTRRQTLLRAVQNLAIWAEVVQSDNTSPEFDSGTDLMRAFWASRRREIEKAGFGVAERDELINQLVDFMESHSTLTAPRRIVESHERLLTELQTLNVLHTGRRTVSFCHQSYLDFLIASRVVDQLDSSPASVIQWLGNRRQQSLFRREQLRQLLFLLADDDPQQLSDTLGRLLASDHVRFHIKQLCLEAVGQLKPAPALTDLIIKLANSETWRSHVVRDVLNGSVDWIEAIHRRGQLFDWLLSSHAHLENTAVWLIISTVESFPALISQAVEVARLHKKEQLVREVLHYSKPHSEPDDVFEFRIQCLSHNSDPPYISWKEVAQGRPDRAIRLVSAFLKAHPTGEKAKRAGHLLEMGGSDGSKAMISAARQYPTLTIRLLTPLLKRIASRKTAQHRAWRNRAASESPVSYPNKSYPKILLRLMAAAVTSLARRSPSRFEKVSGHLSGVSSRTIQAMLLRGWAAMPHSSADDAVLWLLSDLRRLRCGSQRRKPRWSAASVLIQRMSPHCSRETFEKLEQALLKYRDPDERQLASHWLGLASKGYFRNQFGAGQRFLLPALDSRRRRPETTGRIGVLVAKFASYALESFLGVRGLGGQVQSPLNHDFISRVSDKQWLRLISNRNIATRNGPWRKAVYRPDVVIESSIEMFARDFGIAAKRQPERFGRLALKFPADAPADYLSQVLEALQQTKPGIEVPEDQRETWQPASRECIEELLETAELPDDSSTMRSFCWLIGTRHDIRLSDSLIGRLIELTRHSHPKHDSLVIGCDKSASKASIGELQQNTHNCVRSLAAIVISSVLYDHREVFTRFRPALERLLDDEHPVVRAAMVEVCLSVWNIDRSLAIQWFVSACDSDLRLACCHCAQQLFNCAFPEFASQLAPLVEAMCESSVQEIAERGAQEAIGRWLFYDLFGDLVQRCRNGTDPQRMGVASIVARFVRDEKYSSRCWSMLVNFCDDASPKIRSKAGRALHDERILSTGVGPELLRTILSTQVFEDDPDCLLDAFQDHPGSLIPLADLICDAVAKSIEIILEPDREPSRRIPMLDGHISALLLRLYEQTRGREHTRAHDRCLDMIDELLLHRIVSARSLLNEVNR